jgi:hypothetical protein
VICEKFCRNIKFSWTRVFQKIDGANVGDVTKTNQ